MRSSQQSTRSSMHPLHNSKLLPTGNPKVKRELPAKSANCGWQTAVMTQDKHRSVLRHLLAAHGKSERNAVFRRNLCFAAFATRLSLLVPLVVLWAWGLATITTVSTWIRVSSRSDGGDWALKYERHVWIRLWTLPFVFSLSFIESIALDPLVDEIKRISAAKRVY